jgi:hypothetical protein
MRLDFSSFRAGLALAALIVAACACRGEELSPRARAAIALASLDMPRPADPVPLTPKGPASGCKECDDHASRTGLGYDRAARLAKETGKPLVVWVGGNFCDRCVQESRDEFVHVFADSFPGAADRSTVVGVWEGDEFVRVADMDWWVVGDATFGHVPTVRRALRNWRDSRTHFRQSAPGMRGGTFSVRAAQGWGSSAMSQPMTSSFSPRAAAGG